MYNENLSQSLAIIADGIHSASQSTSEKLTSAVDLSKVRQVLFLVDFGTIGASGTVDFQVKWSATSGGTYAALAGSAITQATVASNNNQYAVVCVHTDVIRALNPTAAFVKGSLLPGTAASNSAVIVLGAYGNYEPASGFNSTAVAQILAV